MSNNRPAATAVAPTPPAAASGLAVDRTTADADRYVARGTAAWGGDLAAATARGVPGTAVAVAAAARSGPRAAGHAMPPAPTASSVAAGSRAAAG